MMAMQKNLKVLVIGGAGFIGSYINKMLNQAGYQTVVLDNLSQGNRLAVRYGTFIEGDIGDSQALQQIFTTYSIDAVMHFAAFIDVGESVAQPAKYYDNNVCKTLNLLRMMVHYHIPYFIFSSTAAIFGNPLLPRLTEDHPCHPINPYGRTKWMVEKILQDFEVAYGMKSCCLRYFNAAGGDPQGEIKNYQTQVTNLIPRALRSVKTGEALTIFGTDYETPDGTCIRDYVHIADLGKAHLLGLEKLLSGSASLTYNLGNGQGYSVKEVIQAVKQVTGHQVLVKEGPRRPGDPAILLADATKIQRELAWSPHYPHLETMIEHAWKALP